MITHPGLKGTIYHSMRKQKRGRLIQLSRPLLIILVLEVKVIRIGPDSLIFV